jgi:uncharacterized protein
MGIPVLKLTTPMTDTDESLLFIYIHGFNSKGDPDSPKVKELGKLGKTVTVDYDSFSTFGRIRSHLTDQILEITRSHGDHLAVLTGTSLGGYWSAVIGNELGIPAVLINPSIQPRQTMIKHVGIAFENFKDGKRNSLSEEVPGSYSDIPETGAYLILLDQGDDVLDPEKTETWFKAHPVVTFEGGSHRFEHMQEALPEISKFVNRVQTSM